VVSARTEWETLVALPGGGMRLDVTALASRTLVDGRWVEVDPTLVAAGGGFEVAAPVVEMTFSDGRSGAPLVRMSREGHELVFDVPFELPVPVVEGARLTYGQVLPGVDLVVSVDEDATGFSEVLVVESAQVAAHPELAELRMGLEVSEFLEVREDGGGFGAVTGDGERVFTSQVPVMWDSASAVDRGARLVVQDDEPATSATPLSVTRTRAERGAQLAESTVRRLVDQVRAETPRAPGWAGSLRSTRSGPRSTRGVHGMELPPLLENAWSNATPPTVGELLWHQTASWPN